MCTERENFELHGRENMKSHIYVLTITEGKYGRGPWVSAQMSPGRRKWDGRTTEGSDEVWRIHLFEEFQLEKYINYFTYSKIKIRSLIMKKK